jgi:inorganic triphosphatase YgiF
LGRTLDCYTESVRELELKFSFAGDAFPSEEELAATLRPHGLSLRAEGALELSDRYFDTRKRKLTQAGVAVRERRLADRVLVTLKRAGRTEGALHEREELELPLEAGRWPHAVTAQLAALTPLTLLEPLIDLHAHKERYLIGQGEARAELSLDSVSASFPGSESSTHFFEVELEARGTSDANFLLRVSDALSSLMPLVPCSVNKLERALALLELASSWEPS